MKRLSECASELNAHLEKLLQRIDKRITATLALRPLDAEQVRGHAQQNLRLISALQRCSYNQSKQRFTLYMSSVLPYRLDAGDRTGALVLDILPALVVGLERFEADWLANEINDIDCSNLSFAKSTVGLWGLRYDVEIAMSQIVTKGSNLGRIMDVAALGELEEAAGSSTEHEVKGEIKWD